MDEVLDLLAIALHRGQQTRVAFVNPECVNRAQRDPIYRAVLARFDWVLTDGIGMVLAGRLLGQRVRQNVNGTDLFPRLCELLGRSGHSLYLLGGRPGVAEGVVDWIGRHHPRVRVAGVHHGYFSAAEAPAVIRGIRASGAAVLLVGLGVPRQERWIAAHSRACGAVVTMGVGGLFDFYSGRIPRAPQWLREVGGEWAYRLVQEPGRLWRRYLLGNAQFLLRVARLRVAPSKGPAHGAH
jgi:N-acetylglucosaminyldiphosphoundecaprenol N-acetyl-beta-D-mannosaminyltransferase